MKEDLVIIENINECDSQITNTISQTNTHTITNTISNNKDTTYEEVKQD